MLDKLKYSKPNFEDEWEEALRYRELEKIGHDGWLDIAKKGSVGNYSNIKDVLKNIDLDYDSLDPDKKERFEKHFKEGKIELPIVIKFDENNYDLLGGNTRLSGLIKNKIKPKVWIIDMDEKKLNKEDDHIDMITMDVPLFIRMLEYAKEDAKTDMDLHSATERALQLSKEKGNLSMECYDNIVGGTKKEETNETDSGSSGASEAPMTFLKKDLYTPKTKEQDVNEITGGGDAGSYDAPFGTGGKNPLSLGGVKTINKRASTIEKTKSFPKFGGPDAKFVTINPKCKKFPYCNQGDPKAIKLSEDKELTESINLISKKYGIPVKELEKMVINEINQIFI